MTIEAPPLICLPGCAGHLNGAVHISAEQVVRTTAYLGESRPIYVSRELDSHPGSVPAVRIQGAGDAPMTPTEARHLAVALNAEADAAEAWGGAR